MAAFSASRTLRGLLVAVALVLVTLAGAAAAHAAPATTGPYQLSVFAQSANGYSQPDSILQWRDSIIIGFQNHVAKDGSDGKSSTIVEFAPNGAVRRTFSVKGHNDGLRVIGDHDLWALQNEDANPNLAVIDLVTGRTTYYGFPAASLTHGGGFDDIVVRNGAVFLSVSNPGTDANGVNIFPAVVRANLIAHGNSVQTTPVIFGNASATDIPTGNTVSLNLSDPDSMSVDLRGNIVLTSQADSELIFIRDPLGPNQHVGRLNITNGGTATTIDDTAFVPGPGTYLIFTDVAKDTIYRLDSTFGFEMGVAYSASDTAAIVAVLNLDSGVLTPVVSGLGSARGLLFVTPVTDPD
jgi:hypothetical protein